MSAYSKLFRVLILIPIFIGYFFISPPANSAPNLIYGTANEGWDLTMTAPDGAVFTDVYFASYGTPVQYTQGWCHSDVSVQKVADAFIGKQTATINANNGIFGDPCGGTYKHLDVVLVYEYLVAPPMLNPPTNVQVSMLNERTVHIEWTAPVDSGTPVERYAVMWSTSTNNGWGVASTNTWIDLDLDVFRSSFPLDVVAMFTVRADNDTLAVYSVLSDPTQFFIAELPIPEYTCWDGSVVLDPTTCPAQPTPTPTPTTVEPTPTPTPTPTVEPTVEPTVPVVPPVVPPTPDPSPSETKQEETASPVDVAKDLSADGVLTQEEKAQLVEVLLEQFTPEEAIPAGMIEELGLDYEDLPPNQPVTLDNGVVLIAEVADAIEIFEDPSELLSTVFTDPSKALMAVANVGADLPADVRKKAQTAAVPAVIVTQVISGTASLLTRRI